MSEISPPFRVLSNAEVVLSVLLGSVIFLFLKYNSSTGLGIISGAIAAAQFSSLGLSNRKTYLLPKCVRCDAVPPPPSWLSPAFEATSKIPTVDTALFRTRSGVN